jgi:hypothetical protein
VPCSVYHIVVPSMLFILFLRSGAVVLLLLTGFLNLRNIILGIDPYTDKLSIRFPESFRNYYPDYLNYQNPSNKGAILVKGNLDDSDSYIS